MQTSTSLAFWRRSTQHAAQFFSRTIFADDRVGQEILNALFERAQAGVAVRVICDWLGSSGLSRSFWQPLTKTGGEVRWFNPPGITSALSPLTRDHRKMLAVDGRIAFVTVRRLGVTTRKSSPDLTMVVHLFSPDDRYDEIYIRNYAVLQVKDILARLPGMGDVRIFRSGDYSMRVWLDPEKIAPRNLTASDVVRAIREQNVQVAAGAVGQQPAPPETSFQLAINAMGRLVDEEQFGSIVIK